MGEGSFSVREEWIEEVAGDAEAFGTAGSALPTSRIARSPTDSISELTESEIATRSSAVGRLIGTGAGGFVTDIIGRASGVT